MRNKKKIKSLIVVCLGLLATMTISGCSCTNSMCSDADEQNIKASIEKKNIHEWRKTASVSNTMKVETDKYKAYADAKVESIYLNDDLYLNATCVKEGNCTPEDITRIKASVKGKYNNEWLDELEKLSSSDVGYIETRTDEFQNFVNKKINEEYEKHPKACLVTKEDVDPSTGAKLEAKTWNDAWRTGLLEGLIVYPLSWLMSSLTVSFGGGGWSQFSAILITVIIIRVLMLAMNFKGQLGTIKMQSLQGEFNKINAKLRDPQITPQERQALSLKMMDLYKQNNINPFSTMLTSFISFPIFIAVWAAMNQTLAIRKGILFEGTSFELKFGENINTQIFSGSIAAILLFILMIAGQVVTMKLSSWLKIRKEKIKNPSYKRPEKSDTEKQMNLMMTFMIVMVVMSGFLLPAALVIYWFLGSVFSILQTWAFSTEFVTNKLNDLANRKKKAKVVK